MGHDLVKRFYTERSILLFESRFFSRILYWGGLVVASIFYATPPVSATSQDPTFPCLIEPYMVADIGSSATGIIARIEVDRGDHVVEGQPLAYLESSLQEIALKIASARADSDAILRTNQARLEFGTRRLARTKELFESEISSLSELDEAETAKLLAELALIEAVNTKKVHQLELEQAQAELQLRTIRSSIPGIVMERFLAPGELVQANPIFKIAQIDPLLVDVLVPIDLWGKLSPGDTAQVRPDWPIGGSFEAHVTVVDHILDPATDTFGVRLQLPNPQLRIPAGLKCHLQFNISP